MRTFVSRRWTGILITLAVAALLIAWLVSYPHSLRGAVYASGWTLLGVMVFLTLYGLRKKLPYPATLLSSAAWMQMHIYVGFLSVLLFLLHLGFRLPTGPFEVTLAVLFGIVAGSGVLGLMLSRSVPKKLSVRGEEVLFERIPMLRAQVRERAEKLILSSVAETNATTLAEFYTNRLASFFSSQPVWRHVCQSNRDLLALSGALRSMDRYLDERERVIGGELLELVEAKDSLDYHYVMQGVLKTWLFVHIPSTYVLLMFVAVHVWLVYGFAGSAQ